MIKIKIAFVCVMTMFICCVLGFNSNAYELQPNGDISSSQLLNFSTMIDSSYLNFNDGTISEDSEYYHLASISLDSSERYLSLNFNDSYRNYSESPFISYVFYDLDNNYLLGGFINSGNFSNKISLTIDSRASLFKICIAFDNILQAADEFSFMLNYGLDNFLSYESYGDYWVPNQKYSDLYVQYLNTLDDLKSKNIQYNDLLANYNILQSQYDTISQYNLYGWGTYIDSIDVAFSDNSTFNYSKADLISKNWLTTNGTLNVYQLASTNNPNFGFTTIQISFVTIPPNESSGFPLTLLNISPSGFSSSNLSVVIQDDLGNRKTLDLLDNSYINYQSIYPDLSGSLVDYISISGSSPDAFSSISMVGNSGFLYDSGYQVGYNKGKQEGYDSGKQEGYDSGKQEGYDSGYQVGYNKGVSEDISSSGFSTLFNSILSYPTTMIKEVFNFEFMGINIANLITFIISIGIVAFVIKHFL